MEGWQCEKGCTRMASRRGRMVGTRFGILESILRRSRGCRGAKGQLSQGVHLQREVPLRLGDVQYTNLTF